MRLPLLAFSLAALAALEGCSSGTPVTPDSAWTVNLSGGTDCQIFNSTRSVGEVTVSTVQERVDDGANGASVICSVTGTGPFVVNAIATLGPDTLNIVIPSLTAGATAAAPAIGSVSYESDATVANYASNNCDFYFANGQEGVDPGQVWVAFTCAALSNGGTASSCPVTESVALFENCTTM